MCRLAMEMQQINRVFQISVSIFDSPTQVVKLFQLFWRELITGQVGNKAFVSAIRKQDTNKTETNIISSGRIPKVKCSTVNPSIAIIVLVYPCTAGG